jgi:predicted molibdopterin-dependent oxidoreductase YjgC
MVELGHVDSVSPETIRQIPDQDTLKKAGSMASKAQYNCIPYGMEIYQRGCADKIEKIISDSLKWTGY